MLPETRYARSGDVHIAYQVLGDGPLDLVSVAGWISHLEYDWEYPPFERFHRRLASFSRLIRFDKRGTGLSDRVSNSDLPTLEQRMDDLRAVMDAVGSERAALLGNSEGGPLSMLFAATYPERTAALVLCAAMARGTASPECPWGFTPADPEERERFFARITRNWGTVDDALNWAPSTEGDARFREWQATRRRLAASPGAALTLLRMNAEIDVQHVLPAIRVPTLVIHRTGDEIVPVGGSRYLAANIPGATYVELPGADHQIWTGNQDEYLDPIEEFLTGTHHAREPDRVLATVLCIEIVEPIARAAALGDRRWRQLLAEYHAVAGQEVARFRGFAVRSTGERMVAAFDGPARAVRCARAIGDAVQQLGITTRAGLHTGEIEILGDDIGGLTTQLGARVAAEAGPNDVLVSSVVRDLVAGSGLTFVERGLLVIAGVSDGWRLFALDAAPAPGAPGGTARSDAANTLTPYQEREKDAKYQSQRLTPREREVAVLVGRGYTNRRIAEALVIAEKTAEVHARNIREKLGLETRAQIAAWAARHGLLDSGA